MFLRKVLGVYGIIAASLAVCYAEKIDSALLNTTHYQSGKLPGNWTGAGAEQKLALSPSMEIFGVKPHQAQAKISNNRIATVTIIYLEAGSFFVSTVDETDYIDFRNTSDKEKKKILDEQKKRNKENNQLRQKQQKEFPQLLQQYEKTLKSNLQKLTGSPGYPKTSGTGALKRDTTTFRRGVLKVDLEQIPSQLLQVTITDTSLRQGSQSLTKAKRQKQNLNNVQTLPYGDIIITNIPTVNQGSRGYCYVGCISMISKYHGVDLDIDLLAAKAGYKEGDVENANTSRLLNSLKSEAKLFTKTIQASLPALKREIDAGQPVLLSRRFTRERDAFHSQYAEAFKQGSNKKFPVPEERDNKKLWPNRNHGSHASVIVGYNEYRDEVIFSESWGTSARERRMSVKELKSTSNTLRAFSPSATLPGKSTPYTPALSADRERKIVF
ncbi:MAG: C39 family peptidase [Verrucomicrobiota bacterium]